MVNYNDSNDQLHTHTNVIFHNLENINFSAFTDWDDGDYSVQIQRAGRRQEVIWTQTVNCLGTILVMVPRGFRECNALIYGLHVHKRNFCVGKLLEIKILRKKLQC